VVKNKGPIGYTMTTKLPKNRKRRTVENYVVTLQISSRLVIPAVGRKRRLKVTDGVQGRTKIQKGRENSDEGGETK